AAAAAICTVLAMAMFPRPTRISSPAHEHFPAPAAGASGPVATTTPGSRVRAGPASGPLDAVHALIRIRTSMFQAADPGLLDRLDAPGSQARHADAEKVRKLNRAGMRLTGLRFDVRSARLMDRDGDVATV